MIYLLGGTGYVGHAYQALFRLKGIPFRNVRRAELDYTDRDRLRSALLQDRPEFLINAAGYTGKPNVDACELHKAECLAGNAVLPGTIALACEESGTPWGHVSSGCIYSGDGPGGNGFTELDPPNFTFRTNHCSFYSGTKALGEEVLAGRSNLFLWRLRIPFDSVDNPAELPHRSSCATRACSRRPTRSPSWTSLPPRPSPAGNGGFPSEPTT